MTAFDACGTAKAFKSRLFGERDEEDDVGGAESHGGVPPVDSTLCTSGTSSFEPRQAVSKSNRSNRLTCFVFAPLCLASGSPSRSERQNTNYQPDSSPQTPPPDRSKPQSARHRARVRCQSADSQSRRGRAAKNWFAPSESAKTRRFTLETEDVAVEARALDSRQSTDKSQEPSDSIGTTPDKTSRSIKLDHDPDTDECQPRKCTSADNPALYHLELRLEHPESLSAWRFRAVFTDVSVHPHETVVLEDLRVSHSFAEPLLVLKAIVASSATDVAFFVQS